MLDILNGINKDTKIQRYMDLGKFLDLIENNSLFLSRVDNFEDKLEGGLTTLNQLIDNGTVAALDNLVNNVLVSRLGSSCNPPEEIDKAKKREGEYKKSLENKVLTTVFGDIKLTNEITYENIIASQRSWLDVSCWYSDVKNSESLAMWKIYGGNSHSVCISTTIGKLLDSMEYDGDLIVSKVEYINHKDDHYKVEHCIAPYIHKHLAYHFENEVRFIAYSNDIDPMSTRESNDFGTKIPLRSVSFIEEVKISPEAPLWLFTLMTSIVNERYKLQAQVIRSDLDELVTELGNK